MTRAWFGPAHHPLGAARTRSATRSIAALAVSLAIVASGTASYGAAVTRTTKHSGSVDVFYAASLQTILENTIGPAFHRATGYNFVGFSGASGTLANEISGGVVRGDVFISAAESTNLKLEGAAAGNWVTSFIVWGKSPLVIGYNKKSPFATSFKTMPWYTAIQQPGIRIGRTDPSVDPKGKLTVQAVTAAEQVYNRSSIGSVIASPANIYPEQTLVGLLESGQLDAGFFYSSETKAAGIPSISLGKRIPLAATYTVAMLKNAPDATAATAFVAFLLGSTGTKLLRREGIVIVHPKVIGRKSSLPRSLRLLLSGS